MDRKVRTGEVEVRVRQAPVEMRANAAGELRGIGGVAIPTEVRSDIGPFTEEISREAVADAVERDFDIRGLFNHDPNYILGRTSAGTMTVGASDAGLEFDIPEMPASRADVLEAIKRNDVTGNSFSFTVAKEEWDEREELEKPHRTILQFKRLYDVGPVSFPAYEQGTVVSARALDHISAGTVSGPDATVTLKTDGATTDTVTITGNEFAIVNEPETVDNLKTRRRRVQLLEAELDKP